MNLPSNVSVVIPTFNRGHTLNRAIDSVLGQTLLPSEIIVIDDGSTDGTEELISKEYSSVSYIKTDNRGVSAARNLGMKAAKSDWFAFLDSDDQWLPHKLEKQFECMSCSGDFRLVHCDELWIRKGKRVNPKAKHQKQGGYIFEQCLSMCAISPSASLVHRTLFDELGCFDETLQACEDYDLWLRICAVYPVLYVDEPLLIKFGGHEDQLSQKFWGMDRFRVEALRKILRTQNLTESQRLKASSKLIEKCSVLIGGAKKRGNVQMVRKYQNLIDKYQWRADEQ